MNAVAAVLVLLFAAAPARAADDLAHAVAALSAREPTRTCAELVAELTDPAATLSQIVETREAPPWLPVRAAGCLATVPHTETWLRAWVVRPGWAGIADAVLSHLDDLPRPTALDLARTALAGPLRDRAVTRVRASAVPEIAALAK